MTKKGEGKGGLGWKRRGHGRKRQAGTEKNKHNNADPSTALSLFSLSHSFCGVNPCTRSAHPLDTLTTRWLLSAPKRVGAGGRRGDVLFSICCPSRTYWMLPKTALWRAIDGPCSM